MLIIPSLIKGEEKQMQIEMRTGNYIIGEIIATTEMPVRTFKLKKEARLFESKHRTINGFFIEHPAGIALKGGINEGKDIITKSDYDKEENKEKYKYHYILHETLPIGTSFELIKIEFNARSLGNNHYWIKLLDREEYKDIIIDAVALTEVSEGYRWAYWWGKFIIDDTPKTIKIKTKKVPLFKGKWAKEIKEN